MYVEEDDDGGGEEGGGTTITMKKGFGILWDFFAHETLGEPYTVRKPDIKERPETPKSPIILHPNEIVSFHEGWRVKIKSVHGNCFGVYRIDHVKNRLVPCHSDDELLHNVTGGSCVLTCSPDHIFIRSTVSVKVKFLEPYYPLDLDLTSSIIYIQHMGNYTPLIVSEERASKHVRIDRPYSPEIAQLVEKIRKTYSVRSIPITVTASDWLNLSTVFSYEVSGDMEFDARSSTLWSVIDDTEYRTALDIDKKYLGVKLPDDGEIKISVSIRLELEGSSPASLNLCLKKKIGPGRYIDHKDVDGEICCKEVPVKSVSNSTVKTWKLPHQRHSNAILLVHFSGFSSDETNIDMAYFSISVNK
jgi:hypothetical protein